MDRDQALRIVDCLYSAALGEVSWRRALELVADGVGGSAATLELHDVADGRLLHFDSARLDPSTIPVYREQYASINPRAAFLKRSGTVLSFDQMFMSEKEMDLDPFYSEFLAPSKLRYFVAAQTPVFAGCIKGVVAVQRSGRVRGVDTEGLECMRVLTPHIDRAIGLFWGRLRHSIDPDHLERALTLYGLTPAERRLAAAIGLGDTLRAYGLQTGLSMNTVYTHYHRIKSKLGVTRQSDLLLAIRSI